MSMSMSMSVFSMLGLGQVGRTVVAHHAGDVADVTRAVLHAELHGAALALTA